LEANGHINTINQLLNFIDKYGKKIAISSVQIQKTYHELLQDVGKARNYLSKNGIKKGNLVGVQMDNEYLFIVIFLAITTIGAIANVFPVQMPNQLVKNIYQKHKLKLLIYSKRLAETYTNFALNIISANDVTDIQPTLSVEVQANDLAALYFTGGTIGKPKAVMLTHKNLMRGMTNGAYGFSKILHLKYLTIIPFFHVFGLVRSMLTPLYTGSENYLCTDFNSFLPNLKITNPNLICITPAMLEMVCFFGQQDMNLIGNNLKTIVVGGANVPSNLLSQANTLGIYTCQGYGLTETANLVSGNRFPKKNPNSVGEIFDFQEIKIVNREL
jgi:long-chain acyl-CoA synthetase